MNTKDEVITELVIDSSLQSRVHKHEELMIEGMRRVLKNTPVKVESTLMIHWDKAAKGIYGDDGRMLIWTPDILEIKKDDPKASLDRDAILELAQELPDMRPVWKDSEQKKIHGWQPRASALN